MQCMFMMLILLKNNANTAPKRSHNMYDTLPTNIIGPLRPDPGNLQCNLPPNHSCTRTCTRFRTHDSPPLPLCPLLASAPFTPLAGAGSPACALTLSSSSSCSASCMRFIAASPSSAKVEPHMQCCFVGGEARMASMSLGAFSHCSSAPDISDQQSAIRFSVRSNTHTSAGSESRRRSSTEEESVNQTSPYSCSQYRADVPKVA